MTAASNIVLEQWLNAAAIQLKQADVASARLDTELLAGWVLGQNRTWLHAHPDHKLTPTQHQKLMHALARRRAHEPLAYITGSKEFYGRDFMVDKDTLVPRPESEAFLELVANFPGDPVLIDIGTGSGILAITAVLEHPSWSATATDVNPRTLKVARANAQKLGAQNLVFKQQNLLVNDASHYDIVMANLPYVPATLAAKPDLSHEPPGALFAGKDGLDTYRALFQQLAERSDQPTAVLTESLLSQHGEMTILAKAAGFRLHTTADLVQYFKS